jgi:hypothetical protein
MKSTLVGLALGLSLSLPAQKIENVTAASSEEQIIITYDLIGAQPGQEFRIQMYSSVDNFGAAVLKVTGDIGNRIPAGTQRRIVWNSKEELNNFKGEVTLEVRGEALASLVPQVEKPVTTSSSISPYSIKSPWSTSHKRGKALTIIWSGGTPVDNVSLELLKESVPQQKLTDTKNNGNYQWEVPSKMKTGNYQVKLKGPNGETTSTAFRIKPKVPLILKLLPVAGVGYLVVKLLSGGGGDDELPEPPEPN